MRKHICLPRDVHIGKNALGKLSDYKGEKILVVTGPTTRRIAGQKAADLANAEIEVVEEPSSKEADRVKDRLSDYEKAVAVGGGKVIDVTKKATYDAGIDFVSVPTTCSNDGVASQMASLTDGGTRESIEAHPPAAIIVDYSIMNKCPYKLIRGGIGDTLSNYVAVKDWELGKAVKNEYYGDYASSLSLMVAKLIQERVIDIKNRDIRGISTLIEALISSGAAMGIAGSSRPASGSAHKFSHTLDRLYDKPALHGEQCGLGAIVMSYLQGGNWREIKNTLKTAECPTTAGEIGLKDEELIEAMVESRRIKPNRYTIIEHIDLDEEIARNALLNTGIIK